MARATGDYKTDADAALAETRRRISEFLSSSETRLELSGIAMSYLPEELAGLNSLQSLDLGDTQVADLAPLAGLNSLQYLHLEDTQVADLAPLAGLNSLQSLELGDTQVAVLAPLAGLNSLKFLNLRHTLVADLAPLAGLNSLQYLHLGDTQVADLAPLAGLNSLQYLYLGDTQVADLAPLAGLNSLQSLDLRDTQVADLAPLASLNSLQSLYLINTQVADLAPLAGLNSLQYLYLINTQVADLAPLAGLNSLQSLDLEGTQVADLAPLAGLNSLQYLDLYGTRVAELAPLAGLTGLSDGALRRNGLRVRPQPANPEIAEFLALPQPDSTVLLINFLRRQQGLPDYWPEGYEGSRELPERANPADTDTAPTVPVQKPAAIQPLWIGGRLSLASSPAPADLSPAAMAAALAALRMELEDFAADIGDDANIDRRFTGYLTRIAERLPAEMPDQVGLFRLGHLAEVLGDYRAKAEVEWPDLHLVRFLRLIRHFDDLLSQSKLWRDFKRNPALGSVDDQQAKTATEGSLALAESLREDEAAEFADEGVADALESLTGVSQDASVGERPYDAVEEGKALLTIDLVESVSNIFKPIADVALSYVQGFGKGFAGAAREDAPRDGAKAFRWLRRLALGGLASAAASPTIFNLIHSFPSLLGWLESVLKFISTVS